MLAALLSLAVLAHAAKIEVPRQNVPPRAVRTQIEALRALPDGPLWPARAAALLARSAESSARGKAVAALVAEALARPELLSALPGGWGLERGVRALHDHPAARETLLQSIERVRAQDDARLPTDERLRRWQSHFDGSRNGPSEPFVSAEKNLPGMLYGYGDPAALKHAGWYYVASTSNNAPDAGPIVRSKNLKDWEPYGFIFPRGRRPVWHDQDAERYDFWAPEIHKVGNRFVAYYTARDKAGELRIGAAYARRMRGPWTDLGRPLISDSRVGLIDSHFFLDKATGKRYVIWKKDGNQPHIQEKTTVYISELSLDGLSLVGERREILENDQPWEHDLVEGLWMLERDGWYYLLYSGNNYTTDKYAMGVARSRSPLGPFEKSPERLLSTGALFHGPGHCSVVKGPRGEDLLVYHAYRPGRAGYRKDRLMRVERIHWVDGWPRVGTGFAGGPPPLPYVQPGPNGVGI